MTANATEKIESLAPHERRWRTAWQGPFLQAMSLIDDVSSACRIANISRASAYRVREEDKAFAEAWDEARDHARDLVERTAHEWITTGVPVKQKRTRTITKTDDNNKVIETTTTVEETESAERSATLMIFWLKAHFPERYRFAERFEHAGDAGGPIEIAVTKEEIDTAVERFSSTVVRLADARRAKSAL